VHAVSYLWSLRYKGKKPSQGCADGENVPLQDRMDGEEEAAERLLTGKGCKADVDGEVIDGAEPLSEEQLPRYDGMSLPSHQQSQINTLTCHRNFSVGKEAFDHNGSKHLKLPVKMAEPYLSFVML